LPIIDGCRSPSQAAWMPRTARAIEAGTIYHVLNRGTGRPRKRKRESVKARLFVHLSGWAYQHYVRSGFGMQAGVRPSMAGSTKMQIVRNRNSRRWSLRTAFLFSGYCICMIVIQRRVNHPEWLDYLIPIFLFSSGASCIADWLAKPKAEEKVAVPPAPGQGNGNLTDLDGRGRPS